MAHENATPKHWSAEPNGNYARDPLAGWIVRYDPKPIPTKNADGTTTLSLNFPALAVTAWVGDPEQAANDVADALNENDTLRAENERLEGDLNASEQERGIALSALRLAADRLHEEGAPQAYVDDARSVLLGFTPEGDRVLRPEVTPEQVAALFDELSKGPVQGGKNAQIAYAKCAKIVRSKLVRAASSEATS